MPKTLQENTIVKAPDSVAAGDLCRSRTPTSPLLEDSDDSIITDAQAESSSLADVPEESTTLQQLEDLCTIVNQGVAFGDSLYLFLQHN